MNFLEFIPAFDFQQVFIDPWRYTASAYGWVVVMGFLVTLTCGLAGNFLILRRMALVGDAISHSVLPGLAAAFLVAAALAGTPEDGVATGADYRNSSFMFFGALTAGILTTVLIELIHKKSRVKQDAAIGITFSTLFAIGVLLISLFAGQGKIDLDADCVLYGEIENVIPLVQPMVAVGGLELGPLPVVRMMFVCAATIVLLLMFYKELLVSSFDSGLATSLGLNPTVIHYGLMAWLSVIVVSCFQSVGAILVIAMLILPGATAALVTTRLPARLWLTVLHAALSSAAGVHLAVWAECSTASAMVVVGAGLFGLCWLASPSQGLIRRWTRRASLEPPAETAAAVTH